MSRHRPPRFIAGAICPQCGEMDRVVVECVEAEERTRCVSCGATRAKPPAGSAQPANRLDARRNTDAPARPVRLLVPGNPGDAGEEKN